MFDPFIQDLKVAIVRKLPGIEAQYEMASELRKGQYSPHTPTNAKISAVLILLYPDELRCAKFVLMQRPLYGGVHAGQISLPGGKQEPKDNKSTRQTALRESEEELGISQKKIHIIGSLTQLYIPPSHFLVYPYIGYLDAPPIFRPDLKEVSELIEIKVNQLFTPQIEDIEIQREGIPSFNTPAYIFGEKTVWGATAMILKEFSTLCTSFFYV